MILLDIPQGIVNFASAVLAAIVLIVLTLATLGFRFLFSLQGRLTAQETRMEILWEEDKLEGIPNLRRGAGPPGNPMLQERWEELLTKLEQDEIRDEEAQELLAALLKRREQAKEEDDVVTNMLLGPGIVLTKWKLKEKELREQK